MNKLTLVKTASNLPAALIAAEISPRYLAKLESYLEDDSLSNIAREREQDSHYLGHEETMRRLDILNKAKQM